MVHRTESGIEIWYGSVWEWYNLRITDAVETLLDEITVGKMNHWEQLKLPEFSRANWYIFSRWNPRIDHSKVLLRWQSNSATDHLLRNQYGLCCKKSQRRILQENELVKWIMRVSLNIGLVVVSHWLVWEFKSVNVQLHYAKCGYGRWAFGTPWWVTAKSYRMKSYIFHKLQLATFLNVCWCVIMKFQLFVLLSNFIKISLEMF